MAGPIINGRRGPEAKQGESQREDTGLAIVLLPIGHDWQFDADTSASTTLLSNVCAGRGLSWARPTEGREAERHAKHHQLRKNRKGLSLRQWSLGEDSALGP